MALTLVIDPFDRGLHQLLEQRGNNLDFFWRKVLIAVMMDRHKPETCVTQPRMPFDPLMF
jgi:hypothetical protein